MKVFAPYFHDNADNIVKNCGKIDPSDFSHCVLKAMQPYKPLENTRPFKGNL